MDWRAALGRPLGDVLGVAPAEAVIRSASAFGDLRDRNPVEITLDVDGDPVPVDAILHRTVLRSAAEQPRGRSPPRARACCSASTPGRSAASR